MVVSEAHILGTSVIASDIPIMREVLGDGDHLCQDGEYAEIIENITLNSNVCFDNERFFGWKMQFERIVET